VGHRNC